MFMLLKELLRCVLVLKLSPMVTHTMVSKADPDQEVQNACSAFDMP